MSGSPFAMPRDAFDDQTAYVFGAGHRLSGAAIQIDLDASLSILNGSHDQPFTRDRAVLEDGIKLSVGELESDFVHGHRAFRFQECGETAVKPSRLTSIVALAKDISTPSQGHQTDCVLVVSRCLRGFRTVPRSKSPPGGGPL